MNPLDFLMSALLTPTIPFTAYWRWRLLRRMGVTYRICLKETWWDLWGPDEDDDDPQSGMISSSMGE